METLSEKTDLVKVSALSALSAAGFLAGGIYTAFTAADGLAGVLMVEFFLASAALTSMMGYRLQALSQGWADFRLNQLAG